MNNTKEHQELVNKILLEIGSLPSIRVWARYVGIAKPLYSDRVIQFGIPGESDIDGIIAPNGKRISIEVKTGTGRLSKEQKRWRDMILKFGGIYIEAHSVEDVVLALKNI